MIVNKEDKIKAYGQEAVVLDVQKIACRVFAYLDRRINVADRRYTVDYVEISEITEIIENN